MKKRVFTLFAFCVAIGALSTTSIASTEKVFTHDVAILLPARNQVEINRLIGLDAKPADFGLNEQAVPQGRDSQAEILHKDTFNALVSNTWAKNVLNQEGFPVTPAYESWKIVSARFIPCARPTEAQGGNIINIDQMDPLFTTERISNTCQLEHRLVAQPFDQNGIALPFAIHIINRPYRSGDVKSHQLSREILSDLHDIKSKYSIGNISNFDIYPKSDTEVVVKRINQHIAKFYGGGLLRTLAFMSTNADSTKILFWSGSGQNPVGNSDASFKYSNLIRPPQASGQNENDSFQLIEISPTSFIAKTLDLSGKVLQPVPGNHVPNIYSFLSKPDSFENQQQVLDVVNTKKFFLPNLDCASCHGITAPIIKYKKPLTGNAFSIADPDISVSADSVNTLQNQLSHFINLGYVPTINRADANRPSVSVTLINDAALTAAFINKNSDFWENKLGGVLGEPIKSLGIASVVSSVDLSKPKALNFNLGQLNNLLAGDDLSSVKFTNGVVLARTERGLFLTGLPSRWKKGGKYKLSRMDAMVMASFLRVTGARDFDANGDTPAIISVLANEMDEAVIKLK